MLDLNIDKILYNWYCKKMGPWTPGIPVFFQELWDPWDPWDFQVACELQDH